MKPLVLVASLAAAGLGGCSVLSPLPLWELTKGAGHAAQHYLGSPRAVDTVAPGFQPLQQVCIVQNPRVQAPEVLPALQLELERLGVQSRVFEAAAPAAPCQAWLDYAATIELLVPPLEDVPRAVLVQATLTLQDLKGQPLARSSYAVSGLFSSGRWHSTRAKLAPVVKALLRGAAA